jgi:hypothetical protein
MSHRQSVAAFVLVLAAGCGAIVVNPDVQGPHGEHLVEIQCPQPDQCLDKAREVCGGDYDIVTNNKTAGADSATMMVSCKAAAQPPPDAGT